MSLFATGLFATGLVPTAQAIDPNQVPTGQGYVLLKESGIVLHGEILPQGLDVVVVDGSAKMVKKAADIAAIAPTLLELYRYQMRNTVRMGDGEHFYFAFWCMENNLLDLAGEHYLALKDRVPNHPKFKQLDAQLRQRLLDDGYSRRLFGLGDKPKKETSESGTVRTASATPSELQVSSAIAVHYREEVLPLFRNRCGQSGCHGVQGKTPLVFPPANATNFATLQKSIHSSIALVDKTNPAASPLYKMTTQAHGLQVKPSFDTGNASDAAYLMKIENWIQAVAMDGVQQAASRSNSFRGPLVGQPTSAPVGTPKVPTTPESTSPYVTLVPSGAVNAGDSVEPKELQRLDEAIRKLEIKEKAREARDPFDPEQFNRQFQPKPD